MLLRRRRRTKTRTEQALDEAASLARSGKPIEAIRCLSDANRAERDRRLERRIVELRRSAFLAIDWPREPAPWPDEFEDLHPDEVIPDINASEMTVEAVRSAVHNHGSLIVRGLVDQSDVELLIRDIDTTFEAFDAKANDEDREDLEGWYVPFEHKMIRDADRTRKRGRGSILGVESPPTLFDITDTFERVGVGQLARDHLGEPPCLLARKITLRRVPYKFGGAWHQDGAFMGRGIRSLNIWLALTHNGDDAPGLDIVGRRLDHIVATGDGADKEWSVKPEDAEAAGPIVRPILEPGDAVIFDHMCLHRTGRDKGMTKTRYAIETWFFAPSTYPAMTAPVSDGYTPRDQVPLLY